MARLLCCAWRTTPPHHSFAHVVALAPLLAAGGAAGLVCRWLGDNAPPDLSDMHRYQILQNAVIQNEIKTAFTLLNEAGCRALLIKGWAVGRFYDGPGLRPFGDVDICVEPKAYDAAHRMLRDNFQRTSWVDLHRGMLNAHGFGRDVCSFDELYERTETVELDGVPIRLPCAEDNLRLTCLHMLQSGAWKPLWLCDVAMLAERITPAFNWNVCLASRRERPDWVPCALRLAERLLGTDLSSCPRHIRETPLPRWLEIDVLRAWGRGRLTPAQAVPRDLMKWWQALRERCPTPLRCLEHWRGPMQTMPLPLVMCLDIPIRAAWFLKRRLGELAKATHSRGRSTT